ncbi:hypothetical protein [Herbidospora daliensis]|uniref:hypothetical protein n=1 Tax=Herbidospora daliensis TaxID=295585 RepID=UPI000781BAFD|nr:hypothetical protein [Herbidospora daliensis]
MSTIIKGDEVRAVTLGIKVEKSSGATVNGSTPIFTVSGLVLVRAIVGVVTTAFDGTTTSLNLTHDPTIGAAVDICAATVVTSDEVGTVYSYLGAAITTLLVSSGTTVPGTAYAPRPQEAFFQPGVINHKGTAADAGTVLWRCLYVPISDGASVAAA